MSKKTKNKFQIPIEALVLEFEISLFGI